MIKYNPMKIGDRVRRKCLQTEQVTFIDIKDQKTLEYVRNFDINGFALTVIPVATETTCIACEG